MNNLKYFNVIFRKGLTHDNIKSNKKQGFNLSLRKAFLENL